MAAASPLRSWLLLLLGLLGYAAAITVDDCNAQAQSNSVVAKALSPCLAGINTPACCQAVSMLCLPLPSVLCVCV